MGKQSSNEDVGFWYFTFMQSQTLLKNRYVCFSGTYSEAREAMVQNFGTKWAFQYGETEFQAQIKEHGLTEI